MNSNFIPKRQKYNQNVISNLESKKRDSTAVKEKQSAIYAAFVFLFIIASLTFVLIGENIFMDKIAICLFIIGCVLLIKLSGSSKQL